MAQRIEVSSKIPDARAAVRKRRLETLGLSGKINDVHLVDVYTIESSLNGAELNAVSSLLANPVTQQAAVERASTPNNFQWAVEIGYLPGVTDNVGSTARQGIEDLFGTEKAGNVYTSQITFLSGDLSKKDISLITEALANPLIQRIHVKSSAEFQEQSGMDLVVPKVKLTNSADGSDASIVDVSIVDILGASDDELLILGKQGIANKDGSKDGSRDEIKNKTRRGPLALDLTYLQAIKSYFSKQGRNPTDVELESIAQTWSEHCKHTIFANPLDEITEGLYRTFIKAATQRIRAEKGDKDFCVSVFTDNSGAIIFDENYLVTDKAETHNSPSALDPFGGSITGIVGVNRDTIGFGLGAKPIINRYGFCLAYPEEKTRDRTEDKNIDRKTTNRKTINNSSLYRGQGLTQKMLSPQQILEGVVEGVNAGGNCSGIPTPQGFVFFDERYRGKPLVFVGTVGLIPRKSAGRESFQKQAQTGDYIVMVGGRVGKDGIHGATFSSEALSSGSPATAVQIGDPITQKKFSDAIVKEARDLELYHSITDNGAGGLSCSVAEMAQECGGCHVNLDAVPLKYPGLAPWEIWISESQERMTLAVPPQKWNEFSNLMKRRGVEAAIIGEFTNSGKCIVDYKKKKVMDIDLQFLHNGLPSRPMRTTSIQQETRTPQEYTFLEYNPSEQENPEILSRENFVTVDDLTASLHALLRRPNIASFQFISQQYDHEVQSGSVIKPLQGRGRVNGDATVTRPLLSSQKAVVTSQGINPTYSDIDTYHMAAAAIDTAIRNAIAVGASLEHLALMDNFCWCSSREPERLRQLKEAVKACYDTAVAFGTPFISGKDSMFNDFNGYDAKGNTLKISIPPTLLVSSIGVMKDARKAVSLDAKLAGDLVYVLGETHDELGASEYFALKEELKEESANRYDVNVRGINAVPKVDAFKNKCLYQALAQAIEEEMVASAQSVHRGGLAAALAKTAMGGMLGLAVSLENLPGTASRDDCKMYSESQGRIVVTVAPQQKEKFEKVLGGLVEINTFAKIGAIIEEDSFTIKGKDNKVIINTSVASLLESYKATFSRY